MKKDQFISVFMVLTMFLLLLFFFYFVGWKTANYDDDCVGEAGKLSIATT